MHCRAVDKRRNRIEILFGRLKDWRLVATRYDRCPKVFLLAIALAALVIYWLCVPTQAEHGVVAPQSAIQVKRLADAVTDETVGLPASVRDHAKVCIVQIEDISAQIAALGRQMKGAAKEAEAARRAQTMPGVGPITALAIETFAPDLNCFRRGRNFAAWLG